LTPNGVLMVHTSNRHVNLVQQVLKICEVAEWRDWADRDAQGQPKVKTGLAWVICKDNGMQGSREFDPEEPSNSGHFGSEYVLVARKQEYLPPYDYANYAPEFFTPEQQKKYREDRIAWLKSAGVYVTSYTPPQDEEYRKLGLQVPPKKEGHYFSSTIDFYTPESR